MGSNPRTMAGVEKRIRDIETKYAGNHELIKMKLFGLALKLYPSSPLQKTVDKRIEYHMALTKRKNPVQPRGGRYSLLFIVQFMDSGVRDHIYVAAPNETTAYAKFKPLMNSHSLKYLHMSQVQKGSRGEDYVIL